MAIDPEIWAAVDRDSREESVGFGSKLLHGAGAVLGAPKAGIDYLLRQAGLLEEGQTSGQAAREAVGLTPSEESGYGERLAGAGVEFLTDVATDPLTYASFGLGGLTKAGRAAKAFTGPLLPEAAAAAERAIQLGQRAETVSRGAGAAFAGVMAPQAIQSGQQLFRTVSEEGFTPKAAEEALHTGLAGLGAVAGAAHALPSEAAIVARRVKNATPEELSARIQKYEAQGNAELANVVRQEISAREAPPPVAEESLGPSPVEPPIAEPSAIAGQLREAAIRNRPDLAPEQIDALIDDFTSGRRPQAEVAAELSPTEGQTKVPTTFGGVAGRATPEQPLSPEAATLAERQKALLGGAENPFAVAQATVERLKTATPAETASLMDEIEAKARGPVDVGEPVAGLPEAPRVGGPPAGATPPLAGGEPGGMARPQTAAPQPAGVPGRTAIPADVEPPMGLEQPSAPDTRVTTTKTPQEGAALGRLVDALVEEVNDARARVRGGEAPTGAEARPMQFVGDAGLGPNTLGSNTGGQIKINFKKLLSERRVEDGVEKAPPRTQAELIDAINYIIEHEGGHYSAKGEARAHGVQDIIRKAQAAGEPELPYGVVEGRPATFSEVAESRNVLPVSAEGTYQPREAGLPTAQAEAALQDFGFSTQREAVKFQLGDRLRQRALEVLSEDPEAYRALQSMVAEAPPAPPASKIAPIPTKKVTPTKLPSAAKTLPLETEVPSDPLLKEPAPGTSVNDYRAALTAELNRVNAAARVAGLSDKDQIYLKNKYNELDSELYRLEQQGKIELSPANVEAGRNTLRTQFQSVPSEKLFRNYFMGRVARGEFLNLPTWAWEKLIAERPWAKPEEAPMLLEAEPAINAAKVPAEVKTVLKEQAAKSPEAAAAIAEATKNPTFADKALEVWKMGLLSAPSTFFLNVADALESGFRLAETAVAPLVDPLVKGKRARFAGEAAAELRGSAVRLPSATQKLVSDLRDMVTLADEAPLDPAVPEEFQQRAIGGKAGVLIRTPGRGLQVVTDFLKDVGYGGELQKHAFRQAASELPKGTAAEIQARSAEIVREAVDLKNPRYADLLKRVQAKARERVHQGEPGPVLDKLLKLRTDNKWMHLALPFLKTPGNITKLIVERSPAGFLKGIREYQKYTKAIKEGAKPEVLAELKGNAVDALTRPLVGTTLIGAMTLAAQGGLMTGSGPTDRRARNAKLSTGWQPYSFVVEADGKKTYIPFSRFQPVGALLGFAADIAESGSAKDQEDLFNKGLDSIGKNITSQAYLTNLSDALEAISNPREAATKFIGGLAGSVVPNIAAKVAQTLDPVYRETKPTQKGFAGVGEAVARTVASRVPGLSQEVPAKLSVTGEPIARPGTTLTRLLSPTQPTTETSDAELLNFLIDIDAVPGLPKRELQQRGRKAPLTQEEWERVASGNRRALDYIRDNYLSDPRFQQLTSTAQKRYVNRIFDQARQSERRGLMRDPLFRERLQEAPRG